ncbi:MAG: radical SAM protein [bacterium]|nr:radical SAM protein [bacterium]
MPLVCNYYLTLRCNSKCSFCNIWQGADKTLASGHAVLSNLRQLPEAGVRIVDFTGGEPLLHPDLPLFLKAARAGGLMTTVTTNGLLYTKRSRELSGLVNLLHISIDGATREVQDRMRGVSSYDSVIEAIHTALALGERPDLLFTASRQNYREVIPLAELAQRLGLILIVNPAFAIGGGTGELDIQELKELAQLCRRPYVYLNGGVMKLMQGGGNSIHRPRCKAVSAAIVISPKDELLLPCFHHASEHLPIRGKLLEVLKSPERKIALQREGREDFCDGCTINCYLAPSLPYRFDRYFASFLPWGVKYFYYRRRRPRSLGTLR